MSKHEFDAKLIRPQGIGTWTYLDIPKAVSGEFGAKGQVRVKGSINGHPFRTSARPHGNGKHYIVVNKSIRDAISVSVGDRVRVLLEQDTAPRTVDVPADLIEALSTDRKYSQRFDELSYSRQKEFADWIESAKRAETRRKRITQSLEMLLEGISPKKRK